MEPKEHDQGFEILNHLNGGAGVQKETQPVKRKNTQEEEYNAWWNSVDNDFWFRDKE